MGRPAGSTNKKKAAASVNSSAPQRVARKKTAAQATQASAPRAPLNGPAPHQLQEWLTEMTELDTAAARIRQKQATLKKVVENSRGDWKAMKALFASTKLSEAEATANLEALVGYHRSLGIRVSFDPNGQGSLDDVLREEAPPKTAPVSAGLAVARAHSDGFNSGRHGGQPSDNPFSARPGSEEYVAWHDGRDEGAASVAIQDAPAMLPSSSSALFPSS